MGAKSSTAGIGLAQAGPCDPEQLPRQRAHSVSLTGSYVPRERMIPFLQVCEGLPAGDYAIKQATADDVEVMPTLVC